MAIQDRRLNIWPRQKSGKLREALVREQHRMLQRVMPTLYLTMIATLSIFLTAFDNSAPEWFNIYVSAPVLIFMIARGLYWYNSYLKGPELNTRRVQRDLRSVSIIAPLLALCYSSITIASLPTYNPDESTIIVVVVWCVALVTSFSISTLPITSIMVVLFATLPISLKFAILGNVGLAPLMAVFITLSLLVIYTNNVTYRTFVQTIVGQWKLEKKNAIISKEREFATRIAYTDTLTGLPNRRSFYDKLDAKIQQFELGNSKPFTVAIIDLDGFKPINDVHGHSVGDSVLIEVGERLKNAMCDCGTVARLGGDEFSILANDIDCEEDVILLGNHLVDALRPVFIVQQVNAHLSGSCGFCIVDQKGARSSSVLERADLALYKAKSENRGGTEIFSSEMEETVRRSSKIEQALRIAIADNSIEMHFQPIVDLKTTDIIGMEALARWEHPELGSISPDWFIPVAEHSGLIAELTENLFRKAIRTAREWPEDCFLSFNLSADHLTRPSVGMNILSILLQENLSPSRLEIEVTETAIMRDLQKARATIENLRNAHIKISLDDFGTGYSSINQIKELPFDKIKIDKSFIDGICESQRTRSLVLSVIGMCKNLGICCLAEGIESDEQRKILKDMGCNMGQGYLFGRPMSGKDSIELFNNLTQDEQRLRA